MKSPSIRFLIISSILFISFVFFSYVVDNDFLKQVDFDTTVRLQDKIPRRVDDFFSFFSDIGSFEVVVIFLLVMLVWLRKIIAGLITFILFGLFHIIEIFGKANVENVPPPQFMLRTKHLVEFPQFHVRSVYSYPSGHSGRTIFLSVFMMIFIWHAKKLPLSVRVVLIGGIFCFDVLMLISRIYLGEHWMTDVIGGALLGAAFGLLSTVLYFRKTSSKKHIAT